MNERASDGGARERTLSVRLSVVDGTKEPSESTKG